MNLYEAMRGFDRIEPCGIRFVGRCVGGGFVLLDEEANRLSEKYKSIAANDDDTFTASINSEYFAGLNEPYEATYKLNFFGKVIATLKEPQLDKDGKEILNWPPSW